MRPKNIAWEKWHDVNPEVEQIDQQEIEDFFDESGFDEDNVQMNGIQIFSQPIRVRTPIGVFELDEPLSPSVMFDCWICHTNFPITDEIYEILDNDIEGIECLKIMSKYRFFIGVGKMFDTTSVKLNIQDTLLNYEQTSKKSEGFVLMYQSGECKFFNRNDFDNEEEYSSKLIELKASSDCKMLLEI